jgi:hypothetical protein
MGIAVVGQANVTFKNGIVQCIDGDAFYLRDSYGLPDAGTPSVMIDHTIIQNAAGIGISANAGAANVTNTTIRYNYIGVMQTTDGWNNGNIDLSGGGNTVICSSNAEDFFVDAGKPGIDVLNTSTAILNATNVAWDTAGPDYFLCDITVTPYTSPSGAYPCSCNLPSCTTDAGADGMDAVQISAGITTIGGTKSPNGCN